MVHITDRVTYGTIGAYVAGFMIVAAAGPLAAGSERVALGIVWLGVVVGAAAVPTGFLLLYQFLDAEPDIETFDDLDEREQRRLYRSEWMEKMYLYGIILLGAVFLSMHTDAWMNPYSLGLLGTLVANELFKPLTRSWIDRTL